MIVNILQTLLIDRHGVRCHPSSDITNTYIIKHRSQPLPTATIESTRPLGAYCSLLAIYLVIVNILQTILIDLHGVRYHPSSHITNTYLIKHFIIPGESISYKCVTNSPLELSFYILLTPSDISLYIRTLQLHLIYLTKNVIFPQIFDSELTTSVITDTLTYFVGIFMQE